MPTDETPTPAERMVHDLYLAPALLGRAEDSPLVAQARENVAETARHAHETAEPPDADEEPA